MTNGIRRLIDEADAAGDSDADFADRACLYLERLGYRIEHGTALWLALMRDKGQRKRWPNRLVAARIMSRVYSTAGWPPALSHPGMPGFHRIG